MPSDQDSVVFKLVNSEGAEIKGEELGLLLYYGGTVCNGNNNGFDYITADAICKEMNYTRAKRWTTKESFDIQSNYTLKLSNAKCKSEEWIIDWRKCTISGPKESCNWHKNDVFLSCTGWLWQPADCQKRY